MPSATHLAGDSWWTLTVLLVRESLWAPQRRGYLTGLARESARAILRNLIGRRRLCGRREPAYFAALGTGFAAGVLNCTVSATSLPSVSSFA